MRKAILAILVAGCASSPTLVGPYKFDKEVAGDGKSVTMVMIVIPSKPRTEILWTQQLPPVGRFTGLDAGNTVTWKPTKPGSYSVTVAASINTTATVTATFQVNDGKIARDNWKVEYPR